MKWTLNIGKLFGVNIKVHWTFFLLLAWIVVAEVNKGSGIETILLTTAYILTIFGCVVLHEMGHIQIARRFGIPTKKITLLPIGGVASLKKIPEKPKQELLIALAGPLVNVAIALAIWPFLGDFNQYIPTNEEEFAKAGITLSNFWFSIFSINIILVLFNMIPAFPMDGGRVLRALLAMRQDRLKATAIASNIGQGLSILFFLAGLFYNLLLILIAVFVFFGARGEYAMVQQSTLLQGHTVAEAMITDVQKIDPYLDKDSIKNQLIATCDNHFVVFEDAKFVGLIQRKEVLDSLTHHNHSEQIMQKAKGQTNSVRPGTKINKIIQKLQKDQTALPVTTENSFKGVISFEGVQRFLRIEAALHY